MKIAVSACLLGKPCRYDGESRPCDAVLALREGHDVLPVCPEVLGGLLVPHPPSEIATDERALRVISAEGDDMTDTFLTGAQKTLAQVKKHGSTLAVMKAKSPSCGNGLVYDGTFSGRLVPGYGVAVRALRAAGVRTVDEEQLAACAAASEALRPGCLPPLLAETAAECPVLETERLVLRPMTMDDAADVFAYCSDPGIGPDAGWPVHRSVEDSRDYLRTAGALPHVFGIFEKLQDDEAAGETRGAAGSVTTGPCIGSAGLIPDPQRRNPDCLMLGYALATWAWGRGYMTEASRELVRYGFDELGLSLISVTHYSFNDRSRRVIEKCGFAREGVLRAVEATPDGLMRDMVCYSLTQDEWRIGRERERRATAPSVPEHAATKSELLLGAEGMERLAASTVMVLGLGGVGSNCVEALARGGVGRLIVVDHDVVQESNINRQAIAYRSTLGRKKTEVVAAMVHDINPHTVVEAVDLFVLRENLDELLDAYMGQVDYVVDAIDTVSTKLALAEAADKRGFRLISSMGAANKLQPECFKVDDLYNTENCPLCRIMRKEGRKRGIRQLRVLYSCEQPREVPSREGASRSERSNLGTASYAPPIMGQMIAGEVIRTLAGIACEDGEGER